MPSFIPSPVRADQSWFQPGSRITLKDAVTLLVDHLFRLANRGFNGSVVPFQSIGPDQLMYLGLAADFFLDPGGKRASCARP